MFGKQFVVVGDGLVGLELVVERHHAQLAAAHAARCVGLGERQLGAGEHGFHRATQRAVQDAGVAQHDLAGLGLALRAAGSRAGECASAINKGLRCMGVSGRVRLEDCF